MRSLLVSTLAFALLSSNAYAINEMIDGGPATRADTATKPATATETPPASVTTTTSVTTVTVPTTPEVAPSPSEAAAMMANRGIDDTMNGDYVLDTNHASVIFTISHLGYSHYTGRFNHIDAQLHFDAANPSNNTLTATVMPASVDTHNSSLEAELASKDWFNTPAFPQATFVAKQIEKTGPATGKVTGDLTLMGVTKPMMLDVVFNGGGRDTFARKSKLGFSAKTTIKRSDFGFDKYIPMVGDDVALDIEAEFFKKD